MDCDKKSNIVTAAEWCCLKRHARRPATTEQWQQWRRERGEQSEKEENRRQVIDDDSPE